MTTHSDKRRDKARTIAHESGISVRQAYRRLRNIEVSAENESLWWATHCGIIKE